MQTRSKQYQGWYAFLALPTFQIYLFQPMKFENVPNKYQIQKLRNTESTDKK